MATDHLNMTGHLKGLGTNVYGYGNASHAFKDVLDYLSLRTGKKPANVIMPAFIPAKLYRAAAAAGYEPKFYQITEGCSFDSDEVEDLIDDKTTSIFAIHYFGHPTKILEMREIANRRRVKLIEDCAHVLVGAMAKRPLGTFGDFAIFSPRKMLQLPNGGFLLSKKPLEGFKPSFERRASCYRTSMNFLKSRAKHFYFRVSSGNDPLHLEQPPRMGYFDPNRKATLYVKNMSYVSSLYEKLANVHRNSSIRKANYRRLFEALKNFRSIKPVYPDPPIEWEPYSFPMIVKLGERDRLQLILLQLGISCGTGWPESPFGSNSDRTRELAKHLIELPVRPLVLESQLDRIVEGCTRFEKECLGK